MKKSQFLFSFLVLGVLLLLVVSLSQAQAPVQPRGGNTMAGVQEASGPNATVPRAIPIQGRLTDADGNPLDGNFDVTFRLHTEETGGINLCTRTTSISVEGGLFNTSMDTCYGGAIHGQPVWLGIEVESDGEMAPRQPLLPVPYALSLRPGALILGEFAGTDVLTVENADTGAFASQAIVGKTNSAGGNGLFGWASASTGPTFGVEGRSESVDGTGVRGWASASSGETAGVSGVSESTQGRGVRGSALATTGVTFGVWGFSDSVDGRGVAGWANAGTGQAYGVYGRSDTASGAGVYARGVENGADLILHGDSASQDNGTIYSDPQYPSSDVVIRANDGVRIDLDNDGDGEDADLEIFDKDDNLIFDIDESGAIKSSARSYLWISGNQLIKKNSGDSTLFSLDVYGGVQVFPGSGGGSDRDVMLPVTLPGQLYGQNVTLTGIDVYLKTTGSSYINGTYLRRQSGAGSGDDIIQNLTNRSCTTACSYHLDLTSNNVLNDQHGVVYIAFALHFNDAAFYVQIGGVRLTLEHD